MALSKGRLHKEKYVIAGVITLVVFFLGIFLGFVLEQKRMSFAQEANSREKVEISSLQAQLVYINSLEREGDCEKLITTFDGTLKSLDEIRDRVEAFYQDSKITRTEFELLRREYMISQINFWIFSKTLSDTCQTQHTRVLYFYSTDDRCPQCANQEFILNYLKKRFGQNLLIFSLDETREDEPMIVILKDIYDVQVYPTVIVEDAKFEGITATDVLQSAICAGKDKDFKGCEDIIG